LTAEAHPSAAPRAVVIAHPYHLGDTLFVFPLAALIKRRWPTAKVHLAGRPYVRALVEACEHIDSFIDSDALLQEPDLFGRLGTDILLNPFPDRDLARAGLQARVPIRVGNLRRLKIAHCFNRFVYYSHRRSRAHMVDLNLRNLRPLGIDPAIPHSMLHSLFGLTRLAPLSAPHQALLGSDRFNLILHPKSGQQAREWPLASYLALARALAPERFRIFLTGVAGEREQLQRDCPELLRLPNVTSLMGELSLPTFLSFIGAADGLVASSTGPLHVAAALGRRVIGIYPSGRGIDPLRWGPIGPQAHALSAPGLCRPRNGTCPKYLGPPCPCTQAIAPARVLRLLAPPAPH
jgi:ADP-heptose:LPS heptosyltransferase